MSRTRLLLAGNDGQYFKGKEAYNILEMYRKDREGVLPPEVLKQPLWQRAVHLYEHWTRRRTGLVLTVLREPKKLSPSKSRYVGALKMAGIPKKIPKAPKPARANWLRRDPAYRLGTAGFFI